MTTITYRYGTMAADSRAYSGDKHPIGSKVKIRRTSKGVLIGASSTIVGAGERICDWYEQGCPEGTELPENFSLLVALPNGDVFIANDGNLLSGPLQAEFFSIGSGEAYAQGAFLMGADAIEACRVACIADVWSSVPIYAISHDDKNITRIDE